VLNRRKLLFGLTLSYLITLPDPGRQFIVVLVTKKRMGKKEIRFFYSGSFLQELPG
jgi:hypothetical protein